MNPCLNGDYTCLQETLLPSSVWDDLYIVLDGICQRVQTETYFRLNVGGKELHKIIINVNCFVLFT